MNSGAQPQFDLWGRLSLLFVPFLLLLLLFLLLLLSLVVVVVGGGGVPVERQTQRMNPAETRSSSRSVMEEQQK